jgi:hypothetical protein
LFSLQAALRPAIPPPTMTTGAFSFLRAGGKLARSRSKCPCAKESFTKEPAIGRSLLRERPTSAALEDCRNFRRERLND